MVVLEYRSNYIWHLWVHITFTNFVYTCLDMKAVTKVIGKCLFIVLEIVVFA